MGSRAALGHQGTWLPALLNVCGDVYFFWKLCHIHFKPVLDITEDAGIILIRHEGNGQVFGSKDTRTGHVAEVGVRVLGNVIIEDSVDTLSVRSSAKQIGGHQDPPLEVLELLDNMTVAPPGP